MKRLWFLKKKKDNPYAIVKSYILKQTITKNPYPWS